MIPGFSTSSAHHRNALINAFTFKDFCSGVELLVEGQLNQTAYLVCEGEIRLTKKSKVNENIPDYSRNMVSLQKVTAASFRIPQKKDFQKPRNSMDRHAARKYLLGLRTGKAWLGEEVIYMSED